MEKEIDVVDMVHFFHPPYFLLLGYDVMPGISVAILWYNVLC